MYMQLIGTEIYYYSAIVVIFLFVSVIYECNVNYRYGDSSVHSGSFIPAKANVYIENIYSEYAVI